MIPLPGFSFDGGLTLCSAVDNLLLKLAAEGVPFLRIGRLSQVEQRLHGWMPGGSHYPDTSVAGLRATAQAARVVSSCLFCLFPALFQTYVADMSCSGPADNSQR